jgi:hypothetical protein
VATISQVDVKAAFAPSAFETTTKTTATTIRYSSSNTQLFAATLEKKWQQKQTPVRTPETPDRVQEVRERLRTVSVDAANAKVCSQADTGDEWWRSPLPPSPRKVTVEQPLRAIIAGGGVAGLVAAAACHAKGMKVQIFKQASQYAPYSGPIQIQFNACSINWSKPEPSRPIACRAATYEDCNTIRDCGVLYKTRER